MAKLLSLVLLLALAGCAHSLIVINAGIANKSASSMGAAMTPETYCMALIAAKLSVEFHGKPYPQLTAEQVDFCHDALVKETH